MTNHEEAKIETVKRKELVSIWEYKYRLLWVIKNMNKVNGVSLPLKKKKLIYPSFCKALTLNVPSHLKILC